MIRTDQCENCPVGQTLGRRHCPVYSASMWADSCNDLLTISMALHRLDGTCLMREALKQSYPAVFEAAVVPEDGP